MNLAVLADDSRPGCLLASKRAAPQPKYAWHSRRGVAVLVRIREKGVIILNDVLGSPPSHGKRRLNPLLTHSAPTRNIQALCPYCCCVYSTRLYLLTLPSVQMSFTKK